MDEAEPGQSPVRCNEACGETRLSVGLQRVLVYTRGHEDLVFLAICNYTVNSENNTEE